MAKWRRLWIAELLISTEVESKLIWKHGIKVADIRRRFVASNNLMAIEDIHMLYGMRLYVVDPAEKLPRVILIVQLADEEYSTWRLLTAYRSSNSKLVGRQ